jgi:hypothetical protein
LKPLRSVSIVRLTVQPAFLSAAAISLASLVGFLRAASPEYPELPTTRAMRADSANAIDASYSR